MADTTEKRGSLPLSRFEWENGRDERPTARPLSLPAEIILLGTAIVVLNKEQLSADAVKKGTISRADRLGIRLRNDELELLLWSGRKFRAENEIGQVQLQSPKTHATLSESIRHLEANIAIRRTLAETPIPADTEHSFRERVLRIVGGLNIAQLDELLKVALDTALPLKRRPTGNPAKIGSISR